MEKLLAIISIGQAAYGRWLFQKLLPMAIIIIVFTTIISVMISAMLVGGLYIAYIALLHYGVEPQIAILIIGISSIITIILLVAIVMAILRYQRKMPEIIVKQSPLNSYAISAMNSFLDGFRTG